jgi:hypothetical protein
MLIPLNSPGSLSIACSHLEYLEKINYELKLKELENEANNSILEKCRTSLYNKKVVIILDDLINKNPGKSLVDIVNKHYDTLKSVITTREIR